MLEQAKQSHQDLLPPTPSTDVVVDAQASVGVQDDQAQPDTLHAPLLNGNGNSTEEHQHSPVNGEEAAAGPSQNCDTLPPLGAHVTATEHSCGETAAGEAAVASPPQMDAASTAAGNGNSNADAPVSETNGESTDAKLPCDIRIVDADPQDEAAWNRIAYDDELPLLDLEELRALVLEAQNGPDAETLMQNLANEYKHYFWNQIISEERRKLLKKKYVTDLFGNKADQRIAMTLEEKQAAESSVPKTTGSLFGESLLFKMRCEDKNPKKDTPTMTHEEDVVFMEKIHAHLKKVEQESDYVGEVTSMFGFELTPFIVAKMIMSSEINNEHVEKLCVDMLMCCAQHGNAKELDLIMRHTVQKFDRNHFEGLAFHGMSNIMRVWGTVVAKIRRKRGEFVLKMLKNHDKMFPAAEGHQSAYYFDEDTTKLDETLPDVMIENYEKLLEAQEEQWKGDKNLQEACTVNGTLKLKSRAICHLGTHSGSTYRQRAPDKVDSKPSKKDPLQKPEQVFVDDWLAERHYILVSAITQLKETIYKLTMPPSQGEKESKKVRNTRKNVLGRIKKLMDILKKLGFSNTLRGIQISSVYTFNEPMLPEHHTLHKGYGPTLKFTTGSKYTAFSHASASIFFFLSLMKDKANMEESLFQFTLDGSGFQYLNVKKQFETAMPYIMSLLTLSPKICTVAALRLAQLFLRDDSRELYEDEETNLWKFGLQQSGRPVSLFGMTMQMARLVERMDDKALRAEMYGTFQKLLKKIKSPQIRFGIVNQLITETRRIEMEAQLITELKDTIAYSDSFYGSEDEGKKKREEMRMAFVQNLYPRYFMPRKDSLAVLNPMIALTMSTLFLAIRDKNNKDIDNTCEERLKLMKLFMTMAKEIFRSICKCAEHDMKKVPENVLRNMENPKNADRIQHYSVAKQTLSEGMTGISTVERIVDIMNAKE